MTTATAPLTVGRLAEAAGVTTDAIRHWEREGLFPAPERSAAGYRRYGPAELDRARFIRACQRAGLRLADIGDLLAVRDTGACPCEPAGSHLERRIAEVTAEIARLESLRSQLTAMLGAVEAGTCEGPLPENWCPPRAVDGGECE
ncbi:MerR family transcriptional regulator [Glycomyces artemisiae]|uniref:DNA-binding transcriptional MerR regulator n=2 Tax=Glycomyces artemisiae TaxID=1076443 RepID=A0A2T0UHS8_9ACTN|nr:MerR family transcriptional regulator [Glycomyces artemisiae]PRY57462.1 DNA-binding transcriptional MerR regulator [Glycomyces artemisiae]